MHINIPNSNVILVFDSGISGRIKSRIFRQLCNCVEPFLIVSKRAELDFNLVNARSNSTFCEDKKKFIEQQKRILHIYRLF